MPIIIVVAGMSFVVAFSVFLNIICSASSKKAYLELLSKLEENPNDDSLKEKTLEAGRTCNRKIIYFSGRYSGSNYGHTSLSENSINCAVNDAINKGKKKQNI